MRRPHFVIALLVAFAAIAIAAAMPRRVLIAARDIPDGDFLHADMFVVRPQPAYRTPWFALTTRHQAVGRLANRPITAGNVIVGEDLFDSTRPETARETLLSRFLSPFLPSTATSEPPRSVVHRDDTQKNGRLDVRVEMDTAKAPLLVAGMFVDIYDGEALLLENEQIASFETREDGKSIATLLLYSYQADELAEHAATLRFVLSRTRPASSPPTPAATAIF